MRVKRHQVPSLANREPGHDVISRYGHGDTHPLERVPPRGGRHQLVSTQTLNVLAGNGAPLVGL